MSARALNAFVAVAALAALAVASTILPGRARFTRFVAEPLPQHAIGDFDGDGRPDVAHIDGRHTGHRDISIALSGSADAIWLDASVSALVEGDIDHDGDLDLLATTPTGDVLVWVNDGHGRFTRQAPLPRDGIAGESSLTPTGDQSLSLIAPGGPAFEAPVHPQRAVVARAIRPPAVTRIVSGDRHLVPPLRAPPSSLL